MAEGRPADGPPTPLSEVVADSDRPSEATIEPGLERTMDFVVEDRLVTDVGGSIGIRVLSTPGMIGMMERIRLLGGCCELRSRPGGPSAIAVSVPRWEQARATG